MHNRIRAALIGAAMSLMAVPAAHAVPIAPPINSDFLSLQLRGISFGPSGETVGVHVWEHTDDPHAYGYLVITDLTTATVLYDYLTGYYGGAVFPGTFDSAPFVLPYNHLLSYTLWGREFTNMSILFGGSVVASGGTSTNGVSPSFSTTETIVNPAVPEPLTLSFLAAGLVGVGFARRNRKHA